MPVYVAPPFRAGAVLTAARLNALEAEVKRLGRLRGGAGLVVRSGLGGPQITAVRAADRYLCKAVADIDPRAGATAGTGEADVCWIKPEDGAITMTGDRIAVFNPSSAEMSAGVGIAAGTYCWAERDPFGVWVISPIECEAGEPGGGGGPEGPGGGTGAD